MKESVFTRFYWLLLMILIVIVIGLSCADVPSTGPTPPELISKFRFVNAAADLGTITFAVDEKSMGSLDYKASTATMDFPAGSHEIILSNNEKLLVAMSTYRKGIVVITPKIDTVRSAINLGERRTFDPAETDTGMVRFVHAAAAPKDVTVKVAGALNVSKDLTYKGDTGFIKMPFGDYTVSVFESGVANALLSTTISVSNKRLTCIVVGNDAANLGTVALLDE
ncbi:MAG: DUF4397 domain-containing protein [candidate division KSB1 bacterium]|nr:DUF4397 domain-containing protein [candidate division KSB1 bacterium]MDZ7319020.1 DUF4397 domain-containing protein [candidate division KSB1 bacterium]